MGRGTESTLRIDEPLHFMFLVAYLITYFCCAYLLFVCFKHCRRLLQRKPSRPIRLRNMEEVINNFQLSRQGRLRTVQVSLEQNSRGGVSSQLCSGGGGMEYDQLSQFSYTGPDSTGEGSNSARHLLPRCSDGRLCRSGVPTCLLLQPDDCPSYYDSVSDSESPPPSYSECVPLQEETTLVLVDSDNITLIKTTRTGTTTEAALLPFLHLSSGPTLTQTTSCPAISIAANYTNTS